MWPTLILFSAAIAIGADRIWPLGIALIAALAGAFTLFGVIDGVSQGALAELSALGWTRLILMSFLANAAACAVPFFVVRGILRIVPA